MDKDKDIKRNRPSNVGHDNDPNIRDESATQPGTSTISQSGTDDTNNRITSSAMDDAETTEFDMEKNADPTFDQVDRTKDL
jgi:hypothetical protein